LSLTTTQGPLPFLDSNSFFDHVVTPYPNGPSFFVNPIIIIFLDPNASSFANLHVQNFQNHEPIPHVNMFDSLTWNLIHLARNKSF
jgi:hypothetical protein